MSVVRRTKVREIIAKAGGVPAFGSILALAVCVFTVSWDRLATVDVAGVNLKLAIIAGGTAWLFSWAQSPHRPERFTSVAMFVVLGVIVGYLLLRAPFTLHPRDAFMDVLMVAAKVVIAWGALRIMRTARIVEIMLTVFIWGVAVACIFGLYQLLAFYTGWSQLLSYDGTGGDGGAGRIASFNYEPAYFGYYLILGIGALYARARLTGKTVPVGLIGLFLGTAALVNSRGVYLIVPLVLIACVVWDRSVMARKVQLIFLGACAAVGLLSFLAFPSMWRSIIGWIASTVDPNETSSNAVRLDLYDVVLKVLDGHLAFGVGPGQFFAEAQARGLAAAGDDAFAATANNNWLQAMLDGGIPMIILLVALIAVVLVRYGVLAGPAVRTLAWTYLALLLIAGLFISNLFDLKMLLMLAFIAAVDRFARDQPRPNRLETTPRFAIDARAIRSSTGRYIERLLVHLQAIDREREYTVYVARAGDWAPTAPNFHVVVAPFAHHSFAEQWGFSRVLRREHFDAVHFCMPQQPLLYSGVRITTIHDLNLLRIRNAARHPIVGAMKRAVGTVAMRIFARRSMAVIVPSEYTRNDVAGVTARDTAEITLIYEAAEVESTRHPAIEPSLPHQYLLYVGSQLPYKGVRQLIESHQQLRAVHPELELVLVGRLDGPAKAHVDLVRDRGYRGVTFTGFIEDEERDAYYQSAAVYVFPSLMEGFGLPGLEAMLRGVPVASSDRTCLPEIYGDAAEYFDPASPATIIEAVDRLLVDDTRRDELRQLGYARVQLFSWARTAALTLDVYACASAGTEPARGEQVMPERTLDVVN